MATLTYQQRNALASSGKGAIPPITVITGNPRAGGFATLEAQTMGSLGTPADGFDKTFAPLVAAIPQHALQTKAMDTHLAAAAFTPGTISKANYDPIGRAIAELAPVGDAILQEYGVSIPPPTPPGPGQPGKPGHGGSGGPCGPRQSPGTEAQARGARQKNISFCGTDPGADATFATIHDDVVQPVSPWRPRVTPRVVKR